jgi:hypothetical protein
MSAQMIFQAQLILGYAACGLVFGTYILPKLRSIDSFNAQRVIATIHSFRFFGLIFMLPGIVGPGLPAGFAVPAAYGDFATGVLAILALLTARIRPVFWTFVVAFNVVGIVDLFAAYYHAMQFGLPFVAGQLGLMYLITILYVPMLMITHWAAFYRLARPERASLVK